jgi:hypothetical protein
MLKTRPLNKTYSEERILTMFADRLFDPLPIQ